MCEYQPFKKPDLKRSGTVLFFVILVAVTISDKAKAQRAATAVMEVRVEVVMGATVSRSDEIDFFYPADNEVTYGEFSVYVPEGSKLLATAPDLVEMKNGSGSWFMHIRMDVEENGEGLHVLRFSSVGSQNYAEGMSKGVQTARIEYI